MILPNIDEAQVRDSAYHIWLNEGQPEGCDQEHWLRAIDALTPPKAKTKRKAAASTTKRKVAAAAPAPKAAPKRASKAKTVAKSKAVKK